MLIVRAMCVKIAQLWIKAWKLVQMYFGKYWSISDREAIENSSSLATVARQHFFIATILII